MNATQNFIRLYNGAPKAALANIDKYAKQNQLFDSKFAANACGLRQNVTSYSIAPVDRDTDFGRVLKATLPAGHRLI